MKLTAKNAVLIVVVLAVAVLVSIIVQNGPSRATATYSQFLRQVEAGQVQTAKIAAAHHGASPVTYTLKDGHTSQTVVPADYRNILDLLQQKTVDIEIRNSLFTWPQILANASPFLLLLIVWFFMLGRLRAKPNAG